MFQNTLGVNEWMVKNWLDSSNQVNGLPIKKMKNTGSVEVAVDEDQYVSPRRSVLIRHDHLNVWFDSLAKMPSHYCRQKTNRLYLEGPFSSKMEVYSAYLQLCRRFYWKSFK